MEDDDLAHVFLPTLSNSLQHAKSLRSGKPASSSSSRKAEAVVEAAAAGDKVEDKKKDSTRRPSYNDLSLTS